MVAVELTESDAPICESQVERCNIDAQVRLVLEEAIALLRLRLYVVRRELGQAHRLWRFAGVKVDRWTWAGASGLVSPHLGNAP